MHHFNFFKLSEKFAEKSYKIFSYNDDNISQSKDIFNRDC